MAAPSVNTPEKMTGRSALPSRAGNGLSDRDVYLFREGTHGRLYRAFGCQLGERAGQAGATFAVWAPNAASVSVVGDFNVWDGRTNPLAPRADGSGIWEGFVPGVTRGQAYKYRIASAREGYTVDKADPFALCTESPPATASRVWTLEYEWGDAEWMEGRRSRNALDAAISIYEVHLGSWRRGDEGRLPTYRDIALPLTARGATRPRVTSRRRRGTARRRTSCTWSTSCTATTSG